MLVISSCTKDKATRGCPVLLIESDFADQDRLRRREAELAQWALPASRMYSGDQHRYLMNGISLLRSSLGQSACTLLIISAGYGLIDEERPIVPYEVTFKNKGSKWIKDRAEQLAIPDAVRAAVREHTFVNFLLGKEYLMSIHPPLRPARGQRLVFFTSNTQLPFDPASIIIPAGKQETRYGAGYAALKGKMFEHFAKGLCASPQIWGALCSDDTPGTILALIEAGQGNVWAASTT